MKMKDYQIKIKPITIDDWRFSVELWVKCCLDGSWRRDVTFYAKTLGSAASQLERYLK